MVLLNQRSPRVEQLEDRCLLSAAFIPEWNSLLLDVQQAHGQGNQQSAQRSPNPSQTSNGNMQGAPNPNAALEGELAKLDPSARTVLLKMPPRVREELLQGMREEGPEGYRKFIEDYFKRLTEVKSPK